MPFSEGMILPFKSYPYTVNDVDSIEKMFSSFPIPRVFKTHCQHHMIPKGHDEASKPRYIYVMRNPKDAFVSRYHHFRNMPYHKEIPTWDEAFRHLMKGKSWQGNVIKVAKYSQLSLNGHLYKTDTWCWCRPFLSHFTIT